MFRSTLHPLAFFAASASKAAPLPAGAREAASRYPRPSAADLRRAR